MTGDGALLAAELRPRSPLITLSPLLGCGGAGAAALVWRGAWASPGTPGETKARRKGLGPATWTKNIAEVKTKLGADLLPRLPLQGAL